MRSRLIGLLAAALLASACSAPATPSANAVQTAIAQTAVAATPTPEATMLTDIGAALCRVVSADYLDKIEKQVKRWDDANAIASRTSRIALSGPLAELQSIRRDAESMTVPPCAAPVHKAWLSVADTTISAYLLFLEQKPTDSAIDFLRVETGRWAAGYASLKSGKAWNGEAPPTPTPPVPTSATVIGQLNLLAYPNTNAQIVMVLAHGKTVKPIARNANPNWIKLDVDGRQGWADFTYIRLDGELGGLPLAEQ